MIGHHVAAENDYRDLLDREPDRELPRVTVCIPVYNRLDLLRRTLAGFAHQSYPHDRYEVVVGDDGSDDDVEAAVASLADHLDVRVVRRERDGYGAGQARTLAAEEGSGDVLVFVDADCLPHADLIADHVSWHRRASNLVVIGSRQHFDSTRVAPADILAGAWEVPTERGAPPDDWRAVFYRRTAQMRSGDEAFRSLVSSNFSVRAEHFHAVGGFEPRFQRWGGEDTELGWRLWVAGLFFIAEDLATVFHQTQEDEGPGEGWRQDARRSNEGMIKNLVPHRFYRRSVPGDLYAVPKVSWVVTAPVPELAPQLWEDLKRQSFSDWEVVLADPGTELVAFAERHLGDPRVTVLHGGSAVDALQEARGELVVMIHGAVALDHRMLGRAVRRFDARPRTSLLTFGVALAGGTDLRQYRAPADVVELGHAWGVAHPPAVLVRRREVNKVLADGAGLADVWDALEPIVSTAHYPEPLVALPASAPGAPLPERRTEFRSARSLLLEDLRRSPTPASAVPAFARFVRQRAAKARAPSSVPSSAADQLRRTTGATTGEIVARYVGWSGHDNLGDEVILDAVTSLLPWATIATSGERADLLLLGGGTLINSRGYLPWLRDKDSPRVERAVFGTGVADPDFWGEADDPRDWVEFLSTCAYVGVRGPRSYELLRSWGYRGQLEVSGDPALALLRPADTPPIRDGHLVVSPLWTKGKLWGGQDQAVVDTFVEAVKRAIAGGRKVSLMSCHPADDRVCIEIMRRAGHPDLPYLAGYTDHDAALRLLGSASVVVAERLHAAVLAAAVGAPFVGVEYQPKMSDFAASVEQPGSVVRTDAVTSGELLAMVESVEARRDEVLDQTSAWVEQYRSRLQAAAATIREALT